MMQPQPNSRNCFVCGVENPAGLHMRFYEDGPDTVVAEYTAPEQFQGYPGIVHGGIIAAMLDEVGSRTVFRGDPPRLVVTAKMALRYRRPVPVNVPLRLVGRVLEDKGKLITCQGQIFGPDGALLAEADLTLFEVPESFFGEFPPMEEQGWRVYSDEEFRQEVQQGGMQREVSDDQ